ncbi:YlmC/YmxH family sporulation protein [Halobacillus amylolyticus]|uniref:YlmC/YmxH family sporulation protein n=1 Tax=Halobacillus amylolyticus TaxID=2932259 RepID=A0ABY4HCU6_9BACI|nr:YlmC/YmxH family sporulation protein [Halobacillus amylolyticus]UOR12682.1 YlmC/YmxH family sporulation protein [Halobacillus amylolyticus]
MRLRELSQKEVIDVEEGKKLGILGKADLIVDPDGLIQSLIILNEGLFKSRDSIEIEWKQISIIGEDTILLKKHR